MIHLINILLVWFTNIFQVWFTEFVFQRTHNLLIFETVYKEYWHNIVKNIKHVAIPRLADTRDDLNQDGRQIISAHSGHGDGYISLH